MNSKTFLSELADYTAPKVFNPYSDVCPVFDLQNGVSIRTRNLKNVLRSLAAQELDSFWIGRDLGYRGGRRTGLAFTDEAHLAAASILWHARISQATKKPAVAERTAVNIWQELSRIEKSVFTWNIFPFHPHQAGNPYSNRSHTAKERDYGLQVLDSLMQWLKPKNLIAVGNDAYMHAVKMHPKNKVYKIRHPSYGGDKIFRSQIRKLYDL